MKFLDEHIPQFSACYLSLWRKDFEAFRVSTLIGVFLAR
jgi:hypothetical protein